MAWRRTCERGDTECCRRISIPQMIQGKGERGCLQSNQLSSQGYCHRSMHYTHSNKNGHESRHGATGARVVSLAPNPGDAVRPTRRVKWDPIKPKSSEFPRDAQVCMKRDLAPNRGIPDGRPSRKFMAPCAWLDADPLVLSDRRKLSVTPVVRHVPPFTSPALPAAGCSRYLALLFGNSGRSCPWGRLWCALT
jgi:hypothetical protein